MESSNVIIQRLKKKQETSAQAGYLGQFHVEFSIKKVSLNN